MGQRADGSVGHDPPMVEDFLKLGRGFTALMRGKIGFSSYINRIQIWPVVEAKCRQTEFIGSGDPELKRLLGI